MGVFIMGQLENAVDRLLQRNNQLEDQCVRLMAEKKSWQHQRRVVLTEVEALLAELVSLREQQG